MPSSYNLDRERILREFSAERQYKYESKAERTRTGSPKTRVLLADSHQAMRIAAADILSTTCEAEVVGFASDGVEAIEDAFRLKPDILILEIVLPVVDGIRVTRVLKKAETQTKLLVLTGIADSSFQSAAMEAGAHGYVIKARMLTDLPLAFKALLNCETFCSPKKIQAGGGGPPTRRCD